MNQEFDIRAYCIDSVMYAPSDILICDMNLKRINKKINNYK